jgi:hypothetical protein
MSAIVITAAITDRFRIDEDKRGPRKRAFFTSSFRDTRLRVDPESRRLAFWFWIPGSHHRAAQGADPLARSGMTKDESGETAEVVRYKVD